MSLPKCVSLCGQSFCRRGGLRYNQVTFRPRGMAAETREPAPKGLKGIPATACDGETVCLLAPGGLLQQGDWLAWWIRRKPHGYADPLRADRRDADSGRDSGRNHRASPSCPARRAGHRATAGHNGVRHRGGGFLPVSALLAGGMTGMGRSEGLESMWEYRTDVRNHQSRR